MKKPLSISRKTKLICFIGIDGSGKSTLAKELIDVMNKKGFKTKYWWCKFESFKSEYLSVKILKRFFRNSNISNLDGHFSKRPRRNSLPLDVYQYLVMLSYIYQIYLNVRLPLFFGRTVICDRYIYDALVDFAIEFEYPKEKTQKMLKIFFSLTPKPDLIFLVDLPEEIAYKRKKDIPSISYLSKRREIYLEMQERINNVILLDGNKDLKELSDMIKSKVIKHMSKEG
jgi:dTMP kinase